MTAIWSQDAHDERNSGHNAWLTPDATRTFRFSFNANDAAGGKTGRIFTGEPNGPLVRDGRTVCSATYVFLPGGVNGVFGVPLNSVGRITLASVGVWQRTAIGSVVATPAYDEVNDVLLVGSTDGHLYKLAPTTGFILGTYNAGNAIRTPIKIYNGFAWFGCDNGTIHKVTVSTTTSAAGWPFTVAGSPAVQTAVAYSPSRGVLVVGTSDLFVNCINDNGTSAWRQKHTTHTPADVDLSGRLCCTWVHGMPVIAEQHGIVFMTLQLPHEAMNSFWNGAGQLTTNAQIRAWLQTTHPEQKSLFAIDLLTGAEKFTPCVGWGSTEDWKPNLAGGPMGVIGQWPVVAVIDNQEVAYHQFRTYVPDLTNADFRESGSMGEMVLGDGEVYSGSLAGDMRYVRFSRMRGFGHQVQAGALGGSVCNIIDERSPITLAGGHNPILFHNHWDASESCTIIDRSSGKGLTWDVPIDSVDRPMHMHGIKTLAAFNANHHSTDQPMGSNEEDSSSRTWNGPGDYTFTVPRPPDSGGTVWTLSAYSIGFSPRYTYVTLGPSSTIMEVVEGNDSDLTVWATGGTIGSIIPSGPVVTAVSGPTTVAAYDMVELQTIITGMVATTMFAPYDTTVVPGLPTGNGVSVLGKFLPPGAIDWATAFNRPGYWHQDYTLVQNPGINSGDWNYPTGTAGFRIRFTTGTTGLWNYRVTVTDAGGTSNIFAGTFTITAPNPGVHGPLFISATDKRYYAHSDGTVFTGHGFGGGLNWSRAANDAELLGDATNGATLQRVWLSNTPIVGSLNSAWTYLGNIHIGNNYDPGIYPAPDNGGGTDYAFKMDASQPDIYGGIFTYDSGTNLHAGRPDRGPSLKQSTTYRVTITGKIVGGVAVGGAIAPGIKLKSGGFTAILSNLAAIPTIGGLASIPPDGVWHTLSANFTTAAGQYWLSIEGEHMWMLMEGLSAGIGWVSHIEIQEVLGGGLFGPNLLDANSADMHLNYNGRYAWNWDHSIEQAGLNNVFLKIVMSEKNDTIWAFLNDDGTLAVAPSGANFFSNPGKKSRVLQQYYWRYLAARYGYARAIHSWELCNEADGSTTHAAGLDALGQTMRSFANNRMVGGSIFAGWWPDSVWDNPTYPNVDVADFHLYAADPALGVGNTQGFPWNNNIPTGAALDATNGFNGSSASLKVVAPVQAQGRDVLIRGVGTWTVSAWIAATGTAGGNGAGPVLFVYGSGIACKVPPVSANGTYGFTQYTATFNLPLDQWYQVTLGFYLNDSAFGSAWWGKISMLNPSGHETWMYGNNTFGDSGRAIWKDTAAFYKYLAQDKSALTGTGAGKPVIWGEWGIAGGLGELPALGSDIHGTWLHSFLYATLDASGLYTLNFDGGGWMTANNLKPLYGHLRAFLTGIPLDNGHYDDAQAVVSNPNIEVVGQKDLVNKRAHIWLRDSRYTWYNVINAPGAWAALSGTCTITGFTPGVSYTLTMQLFSATVALTTATGTATADGIGNIVLDLAALPVGTTDAAIAIAPVGGGGGGGGGTMTGIDYLLFFSNAGVPATGLTPTWTRFTKMIDNTALAQPAITEYGNGLYHLQFDAIAAAADAAGVVDGGVSLSNPDRYVPFTSVRESALILTNLDATVSTRATPAQILATPANLLATDVSGRITVGSIVNGAISATTFAANALAAVWTNTVRSLTDKVGFTASTVSDKTGYSLAGPTPIDLTVAIPSSAAVGSIGRALLGSESDGFGKWVLNVGAIPPTLTKYREDGVTVLRTFVLDSITPTSRI